MHGRVGATGVVAVDLLVGVEQGVHRAVADAVGGELQARLDGGSRTIGTQPLGGDEQHAAIARGRRSRRSCSRPRARACRRCR